MPRGQKCTIENCEKLTKYGDICENHRWCFKKYQSYILPDRQQVKICRAPGCESPTDKKQRSSLCQMHRVRFSRHKSYDLPIKQILPEGIAYKCHYHGYRTFEECYKNPKDGYYSCLECRHLSKLKQKEYDPAPHHRMTRNFYFFGKKLPRLKITVVEYERMWKEQNGLCKICKKPETMKGGRCIKHEKPEELKRPTKRLAIDHCHKSAEKGILKIRGLLCHRCNTGIGGFYDSIETLQSAIDYLKSHQ